MINWSEVNVKKNKSSSKGKNTLIDWSKKRKCEPRKIWIRSCSQAKRKWDVKICLGLPPSRRWKYRGRKPSTMRKKRTKNISWIDGLRDIFTFNSHRGRNSLFSSPKMLFMTSLIVSFVLVKTRCIPFLPPGNWEISKYTRESALIKWKWVLMFPTLQTS